MVALLPWGHMIFALVGVLAAALILIARMAELPFLRRLNGALALVALTCWAEWAAGMFSLSGTARLWIDAAVVLAVGLLIARGALIILFEWLVEQRFGLQVPRLARDIVSFVVYLLVAAAALNSALGIEVKALLTTSAVVTVVIGLALQETLGTLLAGLTLTWEQQLQMGTWVEVDGKEGRVEELGWRSLLLRTRLGERLIIPNSTVSRSTIRVLGTGAAPVAVPVTLGVSYNEPPDRVKEVLLEVVRDLPLRSPRPAPQVLTRELADSAVIYECRVWTSQPWRWPEITDLLLTRAHAALARAGMEIPFPQRTVHLRRPVPRTDTARLCREALARTALFSGLPDEAVDRLAERSTWLRFAPGEAVVREGDASRAMYVVASGRVAVERAGSELTTLGEGELFGEIAFLSGRTRSATVRARAEATVVEIGQSALTALLESRHELVDELERRMARHLEDIEQAGRDGETEPMAGGVLHQLRARLKRFVGGGDPD